MILYSWCTNSIYNLVFSEKNTLNNNNEQESQFQILTVVIDYTWIGLFFKILILFDPKHYQYLLNI